MIGNLTNSKAEQTLSDDVQGFKTMIEIMRTKVTAEPKAADSAVPHLAKLSDSTI